MTFPNTNGKTINQSKIKSPGDSSVRERLGLFRFVFLCGSKTKKVPLSRDLNLVREKFRYVKWIKN